MDKTTNLGLNLIDYTDFMADAPQVLNENMEALDEAHANILQTIQDTKKELEQFVGKCQVTITFDEAFIGQEYVVTDGSSDTVTGTVPASGIASVSVQNCNATYTVSSTADDTTYYNTFTTGAYYGQYTATLAVFTATIQVTTAAGAEPPQNLPTAAEVVQTVLPLE